MAVLFDSQSASTNQVSSLRRRAVYCFRNTVLSFDPPKDAWAGRRQCRCLRRLCWADWRTRREERVLLQHTSPPQKKSLRRWKLALYA